jgi:hypothetical protein
MYGERKVREAYERNYRATLQYIGEHIAWYSAADRNLKAADGAVPAHVAVEGAG